MGAKTPPEAPDSSARRIVTLRAERNGHDRSNLWGYVDERGYLHINGQDLGPQTDAISGGDGEYEYFETYAPEVIPRIVQALEGEVGEDVLDVLSRWSGHRSREMQQRLMRAHIPHRLHTC